MSHERETRLYLLDILTQIQILESELPAISREEFMSRPFYQNAIIRSIEVIGEAVKNIPHSYRQEHPGIPWKAIAGTRDKLIHGYVAVNLAEVWDIIQFDLPELKQEIEALLSE